MREKLVVFLTLSLFLFSLVCAGAQAEKKPQPPPRGTLPMFQLADALGQRIANNLQVKTIVGRPMKVGKVTLIPIMMISIGFGGGGGGGPQNPDQGGRGFYMSGEAKPIGFVVISKEGTKFVSVGKIPAK